MNYKHTLNSIANKIQYVLELSAAFEIPTKDYGWSNKRYVGDNFRMAHIERYSDKNLEVLDDARGLS